MFYPIYLGSDITKNFISYVFKRLCDATIKVVKVSHNFFCNFLKVMKIDLLKKLDFFFL